jgi:uncharacterized UBP type Zn finger protein
MTGYTRIKNAALRRMWTGPFRRKPCSHLDQISDPAPSAEVCVECVAQGDTWPALPMCMTCGYIGCCDKAKNRHMARHFELTGHLVIRAYHERGMNWLWCRVDKTLLDPQP